MGRAEGVLPGRPAGALLARLVGKAADLIAAMALWHIPGAAGVFASLFYLLMCDGSRAGAAWGSGSPASGRAIDRDGWIHGVADAKPPVAAPFLLYLSL